MILDEEFEDWNMMMHALDYENRGQWYEEMCHYYGKGAVDANDLDDIQPLNTDDVRG